MKVSVIDNNGKDESLKKLCRVCGFHYGMGKTKPSVIINYGDLKKREPKPKIPIINNYTLLSNYNIIKIAEGLGIPVPHTFLTNASFQKQKTKSRYLIKSNWENKEKIRHKFLSPPVKPEKNEYLQKYLSGKTTEIKVFGYTWAIDTSFWGVWRNENGTFFRGVKCPSASPVYSSCLNFTQTLLKHMGLRFGVADFIYNKNEKVLQFIKLNTCPAEKEIATFETKRTQAFKKLSKQLTNY